MPGAQLRTIYRGNSMRGEFLPGEVLELSRISFADLAVGDVVAVLDDNAADNYVHRLIRKTPQQALTMGDANRFPDPLPLLPERQFFRVDAAINANGVSRPVSGGETGIRRFKRHQRSMRWRRRLSRMLSNLEKAAFWRLEAGLITEFHNGTVLYSCGAVPVAKRNLQNEIVYHRAWKRLVFKIPVEAETSEREF